MTLLLLAALIGAQPQEPPVIPALIGALGDPDVETRMFVGMALARLGPGTVEPLLAVLKGTDAVARAGAAYALGQLGPDAAPARGALLAALKDPSKDVRRQAAFALSRIVTPERTSAEPPSALPPPVPAFPSEAPRP